MLFKSDSLLPSREKCFLLQTRTNIYTLHFDLYLTLTYTVGEHNQTGINWWFQG